jgi:hypothetical protein
MICHIRPISSGNHFENASMANCIPLGRACLELAWHGRLNGRPPEERRALGRLRDELAGSFMTSQAAITKSQGIYSACVVEP